jgi:hypothetical protein
MLSEEMEDTSSQNTANLAKVAKVAGDLDELLRAVVASLPTAKPWQRQLGQYLLDIDRQLQILRMSISMDRPFEELVESAGQLQSVLRVAQRYLAAGRADLGTKAAVRFGFELGQQIAAALDLQAHQGSGSGGKHIDGRRGADQSGE